MRRVASLEPRQCTANMPAEPRHGMIRKCEILKDIKMWHYILCIPYEHKGLMDPHASTMM